MPTPPPPPPPEVCSAPETGRLALGRTQNLDRVREILDTGAVSGRGVYTVEGFFAEHETPMPSPCCEGPLCLQAELGIVQDLETQMPIPIARVGVNSGDNPTPYTEVRRNVVLALDLSASLRTPELEPVIRNLIAGLLEGLHPEDQLALVTFRIEPELPIPMGEVGEDRSALLDVLSALEFGGGTNLWGGLEGALFLAEQNYDEQRENRVILLTDGRPTWGEARPEEIATEAANYVKRGIILSIMSIGEESVDTITQTVGDRTDGIFGAVLDEESVEGAIQSQFNPAWTQVARQLELDVEASGATAVQGASALDWTGQRGDLERNTVLWDSDGRLRSPGAAQGGGSVLTFILGQLETRKTLLTAKLNYKMADGNSIAQQVELEVTADVLDKDFHFPSPQMEKSMLVHDAAARMDRIFALVLDGNQGQALDLIALQRARLQAYLQKSADADVERTVALLDAMQANLRAQGHTAAGSIAAPPVLWPQ